MDSIIVAVVSWRRKETYITCYWSETPMHISPLRPVLQWQCMVCVVQVGWGARRLWQSYPGHGHGVCNWRRGWNLQWKAQKEGCYCRLRRNSQSQVGWGKMTLLTKGFEVDLSLLDRFLDDGYSFLLFHPSSFSLGLSMKILVSFCNWQQLNTNTFAVEKQNRNHLPFFVFTPYC